MDIHDPSFHPGMLAMTRFLDGARPLTVTFLETPGGVGGKSIETPRNA